MKFPAALLFLFLFGTASYGQLIINEVLYDPSNTALEGDANGDGTYDQTQDEFIEFINTGTTDLNVSKYQIFDKVIATGLKTRRHVMGNFNIPSNGAIVIFGGGTAVGSFGGAITVIDSGTAGLSLGNTGEIIILEDSLGNVLDSINTDALSNNPDESYTRNPDITGDFVQHASVTPGKLFSPGTRIDGSPFNTVLSVNESDNQNPLFVFPNPASDQVFIRTESKIDLMELMDLNGKTVESSTSELLRLNDVENGMYVIHIRSGSKQVTRKLVINR
ncbi:MAG TPA: lamin tail domain-containing protein [Catalimonadaceae bacterium]|mgnify:CR=1 FL=1|nr:lamin tail domain-containing protein [Catalimonadaceae bacterium]